MSRLCPPHCKADGGGGKHWACTPLQLLFPRKIHKVEWRKALLSSRYRGQKQPTWLSLKTKQQPNKTKTKITQTYWNQHYRLHIKHAQENVQWELILYIESVSSALQHFCSTQRVLICPGWDSDVTHQNRLFGFHAELIFPQQQRQELLFCSDLRLH